VGESYHLRCKAAPPPACKSEPPPLLFYCMPAAMTVFFLRTKLPTTGTTGTIAFDPTFGKFLPYYNWFPKIR